MQIAHMAGWGGFDAATRAALDEFLDAFADGRLAPERVQFDLAAVVADPELEEDAQRAARIRSGNQHLSQYIEGMAANQVLFASDWSSWPPQPEDAEKISVYLESLPRLLNLTPGRLEQLLEARGLLLGN